MAVKTEAFLAIEASMSRRLELSLSSLLAAPMMRAEKALRAGDIETATREVQAIDLAPAFEENRDWIIYLTNVAMVFGASRVSNFPGTTAVGMGFQQQVSLQMVETLKQLLTARAEFYLKSVGMQLIATGAQATKADEVKKPRVLREFASFMDESGKAYFNMVSSLHTSRVSAYGFTAEAEVLGVEEYQLNEQLDNRICPVCSALHGKRFKVTDARKLLDVVTRVENPDDLKQLQPWPSQSKDSVENLRKMEPHELVAEGWHIPPFHPRCRGLLVRSGAAPSLEDVKDGKSPVVEKYKATAAEFEALGVTPRPSQVDGWNSLVVASPTEVTGLMLGVSVEDLLQEQLTDPVKRILQMKKMKDYLQVSFAKGSGTEMESTLRFYGSRLSLSALSGIMTEDNLKLYLRRMYLLSRDINQTTMDVVVPDLDLSGLGFDNSSGVWVLDLLDSDAIKKLIS